MTTIEMSNTFDVLYNNITSNQATGLNEYEKSVFLTKAENQLVKEFFNNRTDGVGGGFDGSQKRQYDFSTLIRTVKLVQADTISGFISRDDLLDKRSRGFLFPKDYFLTVNEILSDDKYQYSIVPIDYSEYQRLMMKPYNFPVKRAAWRILTGKKYLSYLLDISIRAFPFGVYPQTLSSYSSADTYTAAFSMPVNSVPKDDECGSFTVGDLYHYTDENTNNYVYRIAAAVIEDGDTYKIALYLDTQQFEENIMNNLKDKLVVKLIDTYFEKVTNLKGKLQDVYNILRKNGISFVECGDTDKFSILTTSGPSSGTPSAEPYDYTYTQASTKAMYLDGTTPKNVTVHYNKIDHVHADSGKKVTYPLEGGSDLRPFAEVIGKFADNDLEYKLRYVRTLLPIILDDLSNYGEDLTIDGISQKTECELPVETHQEIVERAVTLAKIAWAGGTATQAAAQQQRDNRG